MKTFEKLFAVMNRRSEMNGFEKKNILQMKNRKKNVYVRKQKNKSKINLIFSFWFIPLTLYDTIFWVEHRGCSKRPLIEKALWLLS